MSASSWWVTCGIVDPVAVEVRGRDLLDPRQRHPLDRAELLEVDDRPGQQPSPAPSAAGAPRGRGRGLGAAFHERLESALVMRPLRPVPVTAARSTPSSRAQPAHGGARVGRAVGGRVGHRRRSGRGGGAASAEASATSAVSTAAGAPASAAPRRRSPARSCPPAPRSRPGWAGPHPTRPRPPPRASAAACPPTRCRRPRPELLDDAGERRRHVHRRLVGLERDQRVLGRDGVARARPAPRSPGRPRSRRCPGPPPRDAHRSTSRHGPSRAVRVDAVALDRVMDRGRLHRALRGQRAQRGDDDVVAVDLEEARAARARKSLRP